MDIFLSKTDNYILRLLKILLAACLATSLLAGASFIFPYTAPKAFAFRILVEIAAALYFYLALKYREFRIYSSLSVKGGGEGFILKPGFWPKAGMTISIAVIIFLFISFLSAVFGVDFYTSFWGNLERGLGVWSLLHFVAWFLILAAVFKEKKDRVNLIRLSVGISVIVAFAALIQRFGGLGELLPAVDRVYGLIGNAGLLASYLIFNIFLAGYLAVSSLRGAERRSNSADSGDISRLSSAFGARKDKTKFIVYCLLLIVNCLALVLTGTRGAFLGLLAGVIIFLAFMVFLPTLKKDPLRSRPLRFGDEASEDEARGWEGFKKLSLVSLAVIFILTASLFLFRNLSFIKNIPVLSRVSMISLTDSTLQSRLLLWQGAWQAWQARPLFGYGLENFEAGVSQYLSPRLVNLESYATDRAHNFIFDYGVAGGWLGLLGYLAMIGAAGWSLWQRKKDLWFFAFFSSLLAAYLIQNLFIFDSFVSYLMLFFALALINNYCNHSIFCHSDESRNPGFGSRNPAFAKATARPGKFGTTIKISFLLFLIFIIFSLYFYNLKPLLAANYANQILSLSPVDAEQSTRLLRDALALKTFASPEVAYQAVIDYINKINQNPALAQSENFYGLAASELSAIIVRSPGQVKNYLALAWLNLYFSGQNPTRLNDAAALGKEAIRLSPNRQDPYTVLVASYALAGQPDKAVYLRAHRLLKEHFATQRAFQAINDMVFPPREYDRIIIGGFEEEEPWYEHEDLFEETARQPAGLGRTLANMKNVLRRRGRR